MDNFVLYTGTIVVNRSPGISYSLPCYTPVISLQKDSDPEIVNSFQSLHAAKVSAAMKWYRLNKFT
jgi:hypothetical protein